VDVMGLLYFIESPIFNWCVVRMKEQTLYRHRFNKDWTTPSDLIEYSTFNSDTQLGGIP
jgi:hypothetical protein